MVFSRVIAAASLAGTFVLGGLSATPSWADAAPEPFRLDIKAPQASKGKATTVKVKIIAAPSYHMNKEFPTSLTLTAPAGITLPKAKLTAADVKLDEKAAEFSFDFTPSEVGKKEIPGDLKFAICNADSCIPQKVKIGVQTTTK